MPVLVAYGRQLLAVCLSFLVPPSLPGQNNVLLILVDDLGTDYLAAYGEAVAPPPTPVIDGLAAQGVLFRNAWSTPLCTPTRAEMLTGRHPFRTGVGFLVPGAVPSPREVSLPALLDLRRSGYSHAYFGKWHLANPGSDGLSPNRAGYSHFAGVELGFSDYFRWARTVDGVTAISTEYTTSVCVDDALAWIRTQTGPWLSVVAPLSVHSPWQAPPAHLHSQDLAGLDPRRDPVPFHRAMVEALDHEIGRLLQGLGAARARTDVLLMSDNGTQGDVVVPPFDHQRAKGTCYQGGVRVPLIVSGPSVVAPGRISDALVGAVDMFATVAELARVDPQPPFVRSDSCSIVPVLRDPRHAGNRTELFTEVFADPRIAGSCASMAMRDARYKVVRFDCPGGLVDEFYDLQVDPLETRNLVASGMSATERAALLRLSTAIDELRYPVGGVEEFGSAACQSSRGPLGFRGLGAPRPGRSYGLLIDNAPVGSPLVLYLGASETSSMGIPLPFGLARLGGGAGCEIAVSAEATVDGVVGITGSLGFTIPIPVDPLLCDATVRHQVLVLDSRAPSNALSVVTSRGLRVRIGS